MRFRTRLILAAAYLLILVVVSLEIPLGVNIAARGRRELELTLVGDAAVVAARINDDLPTAGTDPAVAPDPPAGLVGTIDQAARDSQTRIVVTDVLGRVVVDSTREAEVGEVYMTPDRPEFAAVFAVPGGQIDRRTRHSDTLGEDLLLVTAPVVHFGSVVGAVRMSESLAEANEAVRRSLIGLAAVGAAVILVGLGLAWLLSLALSRPVRRMADTASRLGEGDLEARAEVAGRGELATLGTSFNRMADALGSNIRAQRDFLANASHQLRTPLTGLRLRLEAIEADGGPAAAEASKAMQEVTRLAELVEDLLELARATSAEATGGWVDASEAARNAVDRWTGPAAAQGKRLIERTGPPIPIWSTDQDLGHILDNLIENAIRYTPEGTQITVETGAADGAATVAVSDNGPGLTEEDRRRVFERFYRGSAGKRAGPGTGLGLAVVSELAERWGGRIRVADGHGARFEARFPQRPTDP